MNRICTTIEESKHLLELGIDPETADMSWYGTLAGNFYPYIGIHDYDSIPAWSLEALLELIPTDNANWYLDESKSMDYISDDEGKTRYTGEKESYIEAAYTLVAALLKNGDIKPVEQEEE